MLSHHYATYQLFGARDYQALLYAPGLSARGVPSQPKKIRKRNTHEISVER